MGEVDLFGNKILPEAKFKLADGTSLTVSATCLFVARSKGMKRAIPPGGFPRTHANRTLRSAMTKEEKAAVPSCALLTRRLSSKTILCLTLQRSR